MSCMPVRFFALKTLSFELFRAWALLVGPEAVLHPKQGWWRPAEAGGTATIGTRHRLNMELDLQSLFGLLCTAVLIG